jgi:uncharacterized delta-60 repeat protein
MPMQVIPPCFRCIPALALCCTTFAFAADGDLDTSFGVNGLASTRFLNAGAAPLDTAVLPDGKVLVAAAVAQNSGETDAAVIRFNADGSIDDGFSFDGNVLTNLGGANDYLTAMAVQGDGKILLCGGTSQNDGSDAHDFGVVRLNADGSLDSSFGAGSGKVRIAFDEPTYGSDDICYAIAMQTDGKIVLAGYALKGGTAADYDFAVARLNTDGSLDTTFNQTGKQTVAFNFSGSSLDDEARSVAIDSDGGILVGGVADHGTAPTQRYDMAVARLTPDGQLDANFNTNGTVTIGFNMGGANASLIQQILIQPDRKIVAIGYVSQDTAGTYYAFAAARMFPDGSADTQFGSSGNGRVRIAFDLIPKAIDGALGGVLQSDGKIVLAGLAQTLASPQASAVAFARLGPEGVLDSTFGTSGKATYSVALGTAVAQAAFKPRLQNGRVVVAVGPNSGGSNGYIGAVRLDNDLIFTNGFE